MVDVIAQIIFGDAARGATPAHPKFLARKLLQLPFVHSTLGSALHAAFIACFCAFSFRSLPSLDFRIMD